MRKFTKFFLVWQLAFAVILLLGCVAMVIRCLVQSRYGLCLVFTSLCPLIYGWMVFPAREELVQHILSDIEEKERIMDEGPPMTRYLIHTAADRGSRSFAWADSLRLARRMKHQLRIITGWRWKISRCATDDDSDVKPTGSAAIAPVARQGEKPPAS